MLTGGCFCGRVRYETAATPFHATTCHCIDCRRAAGAPIVAWFSVPWSALKFTTGAPKTFQSSAHAERSFCADCGTSLTFRETDGRDEVDITTASLDEPERVPPADHTGTGSQLSWIHMDDGLPAYTDSRPDP